MKKEKETHTESWWEREVKAAIAGQQEASKEHRCAKKRGDTPAEVTSKEDTFQLRKRGNW